ncbi:hypothetical protein A252_03097, partial [Pseudomonas syringae pv. actinidiae ICMP 9855]
MYLIIKQRTQQPRRLCGVADFVYGPSGLFVRMVVTAGGRRKQLADPGLPGRFHLPALDARIGGDDAQDDHGRGVGRYDSTQAGRQVIGVAVGGSELHGSFAPLG